MDSGASDQTLDLASVFAAKGAVYVANTGYGIVAYDRGLAGWVRVPHAHLHVIERGRLIDLGERENLPLSDALPRTAHELPSEKTGK